VKKSCVAIVIILAIVRTVTHDNSVYSPKLGRIHYVIIYVMS